VTGGFDRAAEQLRQLEFTRLALATAPTIDGLRALTSKHLRSRVATMLENLGYELLTPETAADIVTVKDGKKYLVAFASTTDIAPTQINHLTRLHSAVVEANAAAGFFITTRGFTRDAEAYAATAPLKLVDGPKLIASIRRGMEGTAAPNSYKAVCRQCGEIVQHQLDRAEAIACSNAHTVPPTIAKAALAVRRQEDGSTSRTYTQPRRYTRREVNAHNGRYIAKMKRRKPGAKNGTCQRL
jgi:hypothetical protein